VRRVLFLAYHFPPVGGGGVQRNAKFVKYLPELGYEPVVVTGPDAADGRGTPTDGSLVDGIPAGIEVHRVAAPEPPASAGWRDRGERWLGLSSRWASWWTEHAVETGRRAGAGVDAVFASLVPYESAEAAIRLARELRKPWIADLQDPWALDEMWVYPTGAHRRLDLARMRAVLRAADAVVMNTTEAAERVQRAFPELSHKLVAAIPNGFDPDDFRGPGPTRPDDVFRIVHTGTLHTERGLRHRHLAQVKRLLGGTAAQVDLLTRSHVYLLRALDRLLAAEPTLAGRVELHLAGVVSPGDRAAADGSTFVRLRGYLPHRETIGLLRSADLLFLPMQDLPPGTRATITPGKTYEYVASGRPILAAVPDGDARDLLAAAGTARLCRPADVDAMAQIVAAELERVRAGQPAPTLRREAIRPYERRNLSADLADVLGRLVRGPAHSRAA